MPEVNRDQFHMAPNIKAKPGSQGVLFRAPAAGRKLAPVPVSAVPPPMPSAQADPGTGQPRMDALQKVAEQRLPGTRLYRGEVRGHDIAKELGQRGVGMHWTANPDAVVAHPGPPNRATHVLESVLETPEQTVGRSHASFHDRRYSLNWEAEVRMRPEAPVRVTGVHTWRGEGSPGTFAPGKEGHNPGWQHQPLDAVAKTRNAGRIDYSDVQPYGKAMPSTMKPSLRELLDHRRAGTKQTELFDMFDHDWTWRQDEGEPYKPAK